MLRYTLRRLLLIFPTLLGILTEVGSLLWTSQRQN